VSETTDLVVNGAQNGTDSIEAPAASGQAGRSRRRGSGLSGMLLPELQQLAAQLGIAGTARMRKGELVAAISARQNGGAAETAPGELVEPRAAAENGGVSATPPLDAPVSGGANGNPLDTAHTDTAHTGTAHTGTAHTGTAHTDTAHTDTAHTDTAHIDTARTDTAHTGADGSTGRRRRAASRPAGAPAEGGRADDQASQTTDPAPAQTDGQRADGDRGPRNRNDRGGRNDRNRDANRDGNRDGNRGPEGRNDRGDRDGGRPDNRGGNRDTSRDVNRDTNRDVNRDEDDDDFEGGRGRRGRRYRDRNRRGRDRFEPNEPVISEDDVLLPVAGILDVLDNYAFVRTSGYLTGPNDVYVSLSQVRRYGLRRGDAIIGAVRQPREGERKDKYNALVRLDSVNGMDPEQAKNRAEFTKLTPLYPQERLRLETEPHQLTTRVIDLVMPIGKGQRALIVSPPKAGKTMVLQAIANAITRNNPECHLMVVLVDERPEEVTDMQRSVKGEVIASTFDRPPSDHTTVAELSIERAKRLVEMGHDVVVLLDSITRLGRAYNLAAPASGRILSGGVDSTALYPPKRFLGAARNIENGGSLTIIASALVETGSTMDTVIFEEFKGTGNAEIKLDRRLADKRVFPAVDVNASGTRKEEILLSPDELAIVIKLRRVLHALEPQQALELLLDKIKKTRNNVEFLMQIQKTTLGPGND
jgi:transcription termination factor Rho